MAARRPRHHERARADATHDVPARPDLMVITVGTTQTRTTLLFSCRRRPPRRSAVRHGAWDRRGFSAERARRFSWGGSHTRHWSGSRYAPNGHPLESTKSIVR